MYVLLLKFGQFKSCVRSNSPSDFNISPPCVWRWLGFFFWGQMCGQSDAVSLCPQELSCWVTGREEGTLWPGHGTFHTTSSHIHFTPRLYIIEPITAETIWASLGMSLFLTSSILTFHDIWFCSCGVLKINGSHFVILSSRIWNIQAWGSKWDKTDRKNTSQSHIQLCHAETLN